MQTTPATYSLDCCPYIGTRNDPEISYAYPTASNICTYSRQPASPRLEHQGSYCLSGDYKDCPVIAEPPGRPFPLAYRVRARARRWPVFWLLALALVLALLAYGGWQLFLIR